MTFLAFLYLQQGHLAGENLAGRGRNERSASSPDRIYNNNIVDRLCTCLKEWRAIGDRYVRSAVSFAGVFCPAAIIDWIK